MNVCEKCGFEAKTPQALGAHRALKHGLAGKLAEEQARRVSELSAQAVERVVADLRTRLEELEKRQNEAGEALAYVTNNLSALIESVQGNIEKLEQLMEAVQRRDGGLSDREAKVEPDLWAAARYAPQAGVEFQPAEFSPNNRVLDDLDCFFGASDMIHGERIQLVEYGDLMRIRILSDPDDIAGYLAKIWPDYCLATDAEGIIWVVRNK